MLPVNANNEPDFDWMESFMKTKYNEAIKNTKMFQKIRSYLLKILIGLLSLQMIQQIFIAAKIGLN